MKEVTIGTPSSQDDMDFIHNALREIEQASREPGVVEVACDDLTVTNFTETTSLNAGTATLSDVANFVCTLVDVIKKRGLKGNTNV